VSASAANIRFAGVGRTFRNGDRAVTAVTGVDLEVPAGTVTAFVGPSGCGKSTLLNIAAGLDTGYDGTLTVDPADATRSYMFQSPRLLPWLNAERNVSFVLEAHGVAKRAARERARRALATVGLADARTATPRCCRAGCASASRSPGRWWSNRRSC